MCARGGVRPLCCTHNYLYRDICYKWVIPYSPAAGEAAAGGATAGVAASKAHKGGETFF